MSKLANWLMPNNKHFSDQVTDYWWLLNSVTKNPKEGKRQLCTQLCDYLVNIFYEIMVNEERSVECENV